MKNVQLHMSGTYLKPLTKHQCLCVWYKYLYIFRRFLVLHNICFSSPVENKNWNLMLKFNYDDPYWRFFGNGFSIFSNIAWLSSGRMFLVIEVSHRICFNAQLGADAVNLVAGEKPADVYSGIATR